jgi:hypothetical protein
MRNADIIQDPNWSTLVLETGLASVTHLPYWVPTNKDAARKFLEALYRGMDKGMPIGWSFNWEGMAPREREGLETCCIESLLVVYPCILSVPAICLRAISNCTLEQSSCL